MCNLYISQSDVQWVQDKFNIIKKIHFNFPILFLQTFVTDANESGSGLRLVPDLHQQHTECIFLQIIHLL